MGNGFPKGKMKIAQRFSVGSAGEQRMSPKGTAEVGLTLAVLRIQSSLRDSLGEIGWYPTLKCWANVRCPSGTGEARTGKRNVGRWRFFGRGFLRVMAMELGVFNNPRSFFL